MIPVTKTSNGLHAVAAADTHVATRTMRVKFMGTDRQAKTVTYVQRAVGVTGVVRHFALTVKMTPPFWRKVLKSGPLAPGTMISLSLEQTEDDGRLCTYATDFSPAPEAPERDPAPSLTARAA